MAIRSFTRRSFLKTTAGASAALGIAGFPGSLRGVTGSAFNDPAWNPLRRAVEVSPNGLTLRAAEGIAEIGGGATSPAWMLNGGLPSPLIRTRRGDAFRVHMDNQLKDPLILHWHGLTPPEQADGHPRLAVDPGAKYDYGFTVENRAGTYWYHSHVHHCTAKHAALGIGGLLIVEDDEERALELPSGEYEIPIVLQDRKLDRNGHIQYEDPMLTGGQTGGSPFGNGILRPYMEVDRALYRLRVLNASNARIFRLGRSDGGKLTMIGNDGGLLEAPIELEWLDMAPAERADLLLDLTDAEPDDVITLRSLEFTMPSGFDVISGVTQQGAPMDLLQLRVGERRVEARPIPKHLSSTLELPDPARAVRERVFNFGTDSDPATRGIHIRHRINAKGFDMDRIDYRVKFGETEIWTVTSDMLFAHPMHVHGTPFRVLSREGGRGRLMPWEVGLKDTVLVHPHEKVKLAVRFTAHRGLYLIHCHNLEHEDVGMMANVMVE
jgi:FtsP/CotA-like multicopper oxidase with cupredoxin domain